MKANRYCLGRMKFSTTLPVKKMYSQTLHGTSPITAQRTRLDQIMLSHMLVLEMCPHGDLSLETPITNRTMIRQRFGMCGEMLCQMIFSEEPLLTHSTLIWLHSSVAHLVTTHVGAVREFHVADVALEHLAVHSVWRGVIIRFNLSK